MGFNHYLIIYDIRDEKRLAKVAKTIENYGIRVQKSVFEMNATDRILNELRKKVKKLIKEEDYIVYFKLCDKDWQKREKYGKKVFVEDLSPYKII